MTDYVCSPTGCIGLPRLFVYDAPSIGGVWRDLLFLRFFSYPFETYPPDFFSQAYQVPGRSLCKQAEVTMAGSTRVYNVSTENNKSGLPSAVSLHNLRRTTNLLAIVVLCPSWPAYESLCVDYDTQLSSVTFCWLVLFSVPAVQ